MKRDILAVLCAIIAVVGFIALSSIGYFYKWEKEYILIPILWCAIFFYLSSKLAKPKDN